MPPCEKPNNFLKLRRMSEYTKSLSRDYIHTKCKRATKVSGDDYVMLECPFRPVTHTVCAACRETVPLNEVEWADSGQRISDYRKELASGFSFLQKLRFALFRTAYEGAIRLNLDAKGNPKPGMRPVPDSDIVVRGAHAQRPGGGGRTNARVNRCSHSIRAARLQAGSLRNPNVGWC
jgi:hypothetical protein